jgi:predicted RNase H-like HicB family nuclease
MLYNRGRENVSGSELMKREFSVIIEQDSKGNYVASVPALRGCHTQAKSLDEVMVRIREAIELCLEVQGEDVEELDFVGVQKVVLAR